MPALSDSRATRPTFSTPQADCLRASGGPLTRGQAEASFDVLHFIQESRRNLMSDPKTTCSDCGAAILQITADMYYGRCVPCHRKVAVITPHDFELPGEISARVEAQDEDPEVYRQLSWLFGTGLTHGLLDRGKEQNKLYRDWAPRLRAFADECRKNNRPPPDHSLSVRDREKKRICEVTCKRPVVGKNMLVLCSMPLLTLPVAQRLWPER
jgi:hypothetical protein